MMDKLLTTTIGLGLIALSFIVGCMAYNNQSDIEKKLDSLEAENDTLKAKVEKLQFDIATAELKIEAQESNTHFNYRDGVEEEEPWVQPELDGYLSATDSLAWLESHGYNVRKDGNRYILKRGSSSHSFKNVKGLLVLSNGLLVKTDSSGLRINPQYYER